jgi:hypothetical protein
MPVIRQSYYLINHGLEGWTPVDATTYYFGSNYKNDSTTPLIQKMRIPRTGIITSASLFSYATTVGTNENISAYVRLNNTTDYLIQTIGAATAERFFINDNINIPVATGNFVEIKVVCPTWATNPAGIKLGWEILVKV